MSWERNAQPGELVSWRGASWRIRSLIVAPAPSVVVARLNTRAPIRVAPEEWAKAEWDEARSCWRMPV